MTYPELALHDFKNNKLNVMLAFCTLFLIWGLLTNLNYFALEYLIFRFKLSYAISSLLALSFFFAFLLVSISAGKFIANKGFKSGILLGLSISCLGCFTMVGAVQIHSFELLMVAFFLLAAGNTILQVGANLYIVLSGNKRSAAKRLNFFQGFNSFGTTIAPVFASYLLVFIIKASNIKSIVPEELFYNKVLFIHFPYLIIGFILVLMIIFFVLLRIPSIDISKKPFDNRITSIRRIHVMHFPQLRLGSFAIFAYVGAEVSLSNYLFDFASETVPFYWGLMIIGRLSGSLILSRINPRDLLGCAGSINLFLLFLSIITNGYFSFLMIVLIGFFNSIIFPTIYTLSVNGIGKFSIQGSAVLIMAISGGALIPFIVRNFSFVSYKFAFLIVGICYFYIILYAWKLSRYQKA